MGLTTDDGMVIEDGGGADGGAIAAVLVPDWEGGCADGTCGAGCDVRGAGGALVVAGGWFIVDDNAMDGVLGQSVGLITCGRREMREDDLFDVVGERCARMT